jgi:hypothetical protein
MFAPQPKPVPVVKPKSAVESSSVPDTGAVPSSDISSGYVEVTHSDADDVTQPPTHDDLPIGGLSEGRDAPSIVVDDSNIDIPPSKDKLTEDNVEHLPDTSVPAPTGTAASTVESSRGPDSTAVSVAAQTMQQPPIGRPAMGGYATTAYKATNTQGRSASFQRRLMEQQEAVVLPGNHAVDRATVQFGSLGLNGDGAGDVDEEREEAETRAQPPQHSPTAQPRASLPPAPRTEPATQDNLGPKPAPGLPPVAQKDMFPPSSAQAPSAPQSMGQPSQGLNQFGRYGQPMMPMMPSEPATAQKPYDPFSQQTATQSSSESYPSHAQTSEQTQQTQSQLGGLSSNEYGYNYPSDQRGYNYYGAFGQQTAAATTTTTAAAAAAAAAQQESAASQRNGGAFGAGSNENNFPASQSQVSLRWILNCMVQHTDVRRSNLAVSATTNTVATILPIQQRRANNHNICTSNRTVRVNRVITMAVTHTTNNRTIRLT